MDPATPGVITVRKPKFSCCQLFFRFFTIPRILFIVAFSILMGFSIHWDKQGFESNVLPMPNQVCVVGGIVLAAILMIEGIAPDAAFFGVIFAWYCCSYMCFALYEAEDAKHRNILKRDKGTKGIGLGMFSGFIKTSTLDMVAFFVIAEALKESGILEKGIRYVIGSPKSLFQVILRVFIPAMILSAFCSNSAVVAMCIPITLALADSMQIYPAKVFVGPLAYAVTMGGNLTLVGSPTNRQGREELRSTNCEEAMHTYFKNVGRGNDNTAAGQAQLQNLSSKSCRMDAADPIFVLNGVCGCVMGIFSLWLGMKLFASHLGIKIDGENEGPDGSSIDGVKTDEEDDGQMQEQMALMGTQKAAGNVVISINQDGMSDDKSPHQDAKLLAANTRHVSYNIDLRVEEVSTPGLVGCPLKDSLLNTLSSVNLLSYNGIKITGTKMSSIDMNHIVSPGDTLRIRSTAAGYAKLRSQFFHGVISPMTPYYNALGRSRKTRHLYQVSCDEDYFQELLLSQHDFFETCNACIIGRDSLYNMVLVEAFNDFPELAKASKTDTTSGTVVNMPFVAVVPSSRTPRTDSAIDIARGLIILIAFLACIFANSGLLPTVEDDYGFSVQLFFVAFLAIFLRTLTWKSAIAGIHSGPVFTFAAAAVLKDVIKTSNCDHLLGGWITAVVGHNSVLIVIVGYLFTALATNFISNPGCVSIFTGVLVNVAEQAGMPYKPIVVLVVAAAVANYMTPVGCGHNMLSYAACNYKFSDYALFGWPTQIMMMLSTCGFISLVIMLYPFLPEFML